MRKSLFLFFVIFSSSLVAQVSGSPLDASPKSLQKAWVDSTYNSLSLKQKIGQLYMVQVFSNQDETSMKAILDQIKKYHIVVQYYFRFISTFCKSFSGVVHKKV